MSEFSALVTLDGTPLSEEALDLLPFLEALGVRKVRLTSVWEDFEGPASMTAVQYKESNQKGAGILSAYLDSKAREFASASLEVVPCLGFGAPAAELLRIARETDSALIVIATHGRTGVDRWRLGSVADKVIRGASCPTLVVGPNVSVNLNDYELRQIMMPLDASSLSETALPLVASIAGRTLAKVDLVQVASVPTTPLTDGYVYSINVPEMLDAVEEGAAAYLKQRDMPGVLVERTVLRSMFSGGIGDALIAHLQKKPADLVVMTSHGRHGVLRSALGSVTDELLRGPAPVLILRAGERDINHLVMEAANAVSIS